MASVAIDIPAMTTAHAIDPKSERNAARARGQATAWARPNASLLRRSFPALATTVQVLVDLVAIFAACAVSYALWSRVQPLPQVVPIVDYLPLFGIIASVLLILYFWLGMYRQQKTILNIEEFRGALKAMIFGLLIVTFLHFILEESVIYPRAAESQSGFYRLLAEAHHAIAFLPVNVYSRYVIALAFLIGFVFVAIERFMCFKALQYLHLRGIGTKNLLILGSGSLGRLIQKRLFLSPRLGFNLVGFLEEDPARVGQRISKSRVLGTVADLERLVHSHKVGLVLIANASLSDHEREDLALRCLGSGCEVAFVPPLFVSSTLPPLKVSKLETFPLLTFARPRNRPLYHTFKRVFDLIVASAAILIFLPFFLLLPVLIRLTSPGPAFFRQTRIGKDGKPFEMLKFRTMFVDAPKYSTSPRSSDDPRLTRIGRFLRRTSIDELPQLLNVVAGDMSIVGPRPEMPFIVERYDALIRQRLNVKPGMTGLWQISHAREEDIHENVDYDLYYVENASIAMDLVICILTVFSVLRGVGAH